MTETPIASPPEKDLRKACADADKAAAALLDALDRRDDALRRLPSRGGNRGAVINAMMTKPQKESPLVRLGLDRHLRIPGSRLHRTFVEQIEVIVGPKGSLSFNRTRAAPAEEQPVV